MHCRPAYDELTDARTCDTHRATRAIRIRRWIVWWFSSIAVDAALGRRRMRPQKDSSFVVVASARNARPASAHAHRQSPVTACTKIAQPKAQPSKSTHTKTIRVPFQAGMHARASTARMHTRTHTRAPNGLIPPVASRRTLSAQENRRQQQQLHARKHPKY